MLQLRNRVSSKSTLRTFQVKFVNRVVDHLIAERPIFQHLRFRVRFRNERQGTVGVGWTGNAIRVLDSALVMLLRVKRLFVRLKVRVREEQSVGSDLPKCILMPAARPCFIRAPLNCFSKHRESGMILAFQYSPKRSRCDWHLR